MHVIFPFFNESKKWTNHNASFPCGMLQFLGRLKSTKLYRFPGSLICVLYMLPRNLFDLPGNVGNVRRKCYGHGQISVRQARKKEKRFKNHQATSVTSWLARVWQAVRKGLGDRSYKHLWHEPHNDCAIQADDWLWQGTRRPCRKLRPPWVTAMTVAQNK